MTKLEKKLQQIETEMTCQLGGDFFIDRPGKRMFSYCPYMAMESVAAVDCGYLRNQSVWHEDKRYFACGGPRINIPMKATKTEYADFVTEK